MRAGGTRAAVVQHSGESDPLIQSSGRSTMSTQNEWQNVENKKIKANQKKRERTSPDEKNTGRNAKQTKLVDYWLGSPPVSTANSFGLLESQETEDIENSDDTIKTVKVPPMFISGVGNITPLINLLNAIAKDNYYIKVQSQEQVRVQAKTIETYDKIIESLKEKNTEYHTYQKKQEKSFKVVLCHIHHSTEIESIKEEIESHGHKVRNIVNMRQKITKKPLSLFAVELEPADNNKSIYTIEYLLNMKIKFEVPHYNREIPQCTNCQTYGHTKNFCSRAPRCVKCTGSHRTSNCLRKKRSDQVKCVLCEGNHPANYKVCEIYKQLRNAHFPTLRNKQTTKNQNAVTSVSQTPQPTSQPKSGESIRTGSTYAQAASGQRIEDNSMNNSTPNQPYIIQQSNDLQELKSMMKGLMEQMSTMLNLLTTIVSKMPQC